MSSESLNQRYFTSYTGVTLPFNLTNELDIENMDNRITYFVGYYDEAGLLMIIEKVVYGEIEFTHHYKYNENSDISKAVITEEGESPRTIVFDAIGKMQEVQ